MPREQILPFGKVFEILNERISENLFRRLWIPEFRLTVEGRLDREHKRYGVMFKENGKLVSVVANVTPLSYNFLYVWAYASVLARLKDWHHEIVHWADSVCPAVSIPPSNKVGGKDAQVHVVMDDLFSPLYWKENKHTIFFEQGAKNRPHNILNANITHLDTPFELNLPACWNNRMLKDKLVASLREILPADGLQWLIRCCAEKNA